MTIPLFTITNIISLENFRSNHIQKFVARLYKI